MANISKRTRKHKIRYKYKWSRSAFTLAEILIAVAILVILAGILLSTNIKSAFQKGRDSKRKQDLNKLVRHFEDYYNDNIHYPAGNQADGTIAGAPWGEPLEGYIQALPKDPLSPSQDYYYQTSPINQNFFVIYAKLENTNDDDIIKVGCENGCGPDLAYNYVVHSPNVVMLAGLPDFGGGLGGDGGGGGGDGGGGGGEPSPTEGPTPTLGPSPTAEPTAYPTVIPEGECQTEGCCSHNECCWNKWCGGPASYWPLTQYCSQDKRCLYDSYWGQWVCGFDPICPP